ncbi:SIMPL domain-containing protein [Actinoplanes friuliensis]|jgi:uncharacterized protein YggE|uniref:DUF541 domain-containing protein n=1 Tax=Actinoplanes friuliensis DSM 7358 TaxID=1246995 RepID=U5W9W8_9ACTN|nr:SIMPL domain-containing protein [Actinoplanes friuliensis]AGZ45998.1 hypothetical protein AFR_38720 [Actinoplanes friuliensis DSM 7358]
MADQPMIVVRGEATREVPPELAVFSVTVSARDKDRQTALTRLTERAAELRSHLDDFPDAIERRETSGVQVHAELKRGGGERIAAYAGSVSTTVTVTDFSALGELLLRLANQDQTSISGPWWQLRPGSRAGADVRRAAISDALGRAREYAEAVGAEVDRLVEISDQVSDGRGDPMFRMAVGGSSGADLELEVDPQLQTVEATVIVRVTITEPTALK